MGIGLEDYLLVGLTTALVLLILWTFPRFDIMLRANDSAAYKIIAPYDETRYLHFMQRFEENELKILKQSLAKKGTNMECFWQVFGKSDRHERLIHAFMSDPEVEEFTVS